jgi:NAD(P)-dependent dehydrogenase (short-subunit alcohol dehydrogenase family)
MPGLVHDDVMVLPLGTMRKLANSDLVMVRRGRGGGEDVMRELAGKTAFVTGGASGIGLALGKVLAEAGMTVMLVDIERVALDEAVATLAVSSPDVRGIVCDVADPASVERAALATHQAFGNVHVVCNNAGVAGGSGIDDISLATWRWVLDVNLMGVVHGIRTFLPHIRGHGEGGHIVNTASMAGLESGLGFSPYVASKFAVVALSEGLRSELKSLGIGVTVLCPGFVRTHMHRSARNRPERYGAWRPPEPGSKAAALAELQADLQQAGLDTDIVARRTVEAIREDQLYVFTHPQMHGEVKERFATIVAAMDRAATR